MKKIHRMTRGGLYAGGAVLIIVAGLLYFFSVPKTSLASGSEPILGYAWSENVGWIDLNCQNDDSCATVNYGFSINPDGTISGDAWSDNIGWVSANASDLAGCPSGSCTASIVNGKLEGWLKALAADGNGWDGWISLSGSEYGPALDDGNFSGYAWGSDVVGWVDFSLATTDYQACEADVGTISSCDTTTETITSTTTDAYCGQTVTHTQCTDPGSFCSGNISYCQYPTPTFPPPLSGGESDGHLHITPQLVSSTQTVHLYWNVDNVQSCTVQGTNGDGTSESTDTASPGLWNTESGDVTSSPITSQVTYTLSCQGYGGNDVHETQTVTLAPNFHEF